MYLHKTGKNGISANYKNMPIYCTGYQSLFTLPSVFHFIWVKSYTWNLKLLSPTENGSGWKGSLEVILSPFPANAGSLGARYSGLSTDSCMYLQGRRLCNLFGQLFQHSVTFTVKMFFLTFNWNYLCPSFCSLTLVLLLGTNKTPGSIL